MLAFEKSEYLERVKKVKERMVEQGIDVILASDPANICYLTGFEGWSFYVHQTVIVALDEEQPTIIIRGQDSFGAELTTWLDKENIIPYPDFYVNNSVQHTMDFVSDILIKKGLGNKTIGVEKEGFYFSMLCGERIEKGLPDAKIVDSDYLVNWVKLIKSDNEIACIRKAATISEKVMRTVIDKIAVGVRQCDVAAAAYQAQVSGTDEYGGEFSAMFPFMSAGQRSSACHLPWTDQPYKKGESLIFEFSGVHKRYHSPLARTISLGEPSQKLNDSANVVIEGLEAALAAVKPGAACEDVEKAWNQVITKYGIIKDSRIGYSIGLNFPPNWGENSCNLRPGDKTVLQPNMTFHMIPGVWMDDFGIHFSETFRVTENGCETMANFPRELFIK